MDLNNDYINFEWDDNKANVNVEKHGISFERATEVFSDEFARVLPDKEHSDVEDRFHIIGMDLTSSILLVCYCERNCGNTLRLISARNATKNEENQYWSLRRKYEC